MNVALINGSLHCTPSKRTLLQSCVGGFEFALDGMLNVHASEVKYRKPTVSLQKCTVPRPFVGKTGWWARCRLNVFKRVFSKMVNNCCVVGCTNYVGKKPVLCFYSFPADTQRRENTRVSVMNTSLLVSFASTCTTIVFVGFFREEHLSAINKYIMVIIARPHCVQWKYLMGN